MSTTTITLRGHVYNMPSNFRVLQEVTDRVCDPLKVLAEAARSGGSMVNLPLTQSQCILMLAIGVKAAGKPTDMAEDDLCQAIYELGAGHYTPLAIVYLAALANGDSHAEVPAVPKGRAAARRR